jgi:hypothetical protein
MLLYRFPATYNRSTIAHRLLTHRSAIVYSAASLLYTTAQPLLNDCSATAHHRRTPTASPLLLYASLSPPRNLQPLNHCSPIAHPSLGSCLFCRFSALYNRSTIAQQLLN